MFDKRNSQSEEFGKALIAAPAFQDLGGGVVLLDGIPNAARLDRARSSLHYYTDARFMVYLQMAHPPEQIGRIRVETLGTSDIPQVEVLNSLTAAADMYHIEHRSLVTRWDARTASISFDHAPYLSAVLEGLGAVGHLPLGEAMALRRYVCRER